MVITMEVAPALQSSGEATPPSIPVETLHETGGGDGDTFWKIVNGPGGLGPLVLGRSITQGEWHYD